MLAASNRPFYPYVTLHTYSRKCGITVQLNLNTVGQNSEDDPRDSPCAISNSISTAARCVAPALRIYGRLLAVRQKGGLKSKLSNSTLTQIEGLASTR